MNNTIKNKPSVKRKHPKCEKGREREGSKEAVFLS